MPTKTVKKATRKTARKPAKKATAKKTAKKTVRKKPAAKKGTTKKRVAKQCSCTLVCRPEECFWVNNGPVVDSIKNLKVAFKNMSKEQYEYHTTREGNDFARWIEDCFNDAPRASRVAKAKTPAGAARAVSTRCCK